MDRDSLIEGYFHLGINYTEILAFLVLCHGICLSMRQLKRILRERGLTRRSRLSPVNEIVDAIESELQGSGRLLGYRLMHKRIGLSHSLVVDRETVRAVMKALDPEGVERRSQHRLVRRNYHAKGPNFIWHIDGYDKLKPFGFCIHGAIDGYSRRIMWLEVDHSNKKSMHHSKILFKLCSQGRRNSNGCQGRLRHRELLRCSFSALLQRRTRRHLRRGYQFHVRALCLKSKN